MAPPGSNRRERGKGGTSTPAANKDTPETNKDGKNEKTGKATERGKVRKSRANPKPKAEPIHPTTGGKSIAKVLADSVDNEDKDPKQSEDDAGDDVFLNSIRRPSTTKNNLFSLAAHNNSDDEYETEDEEDLEALERANNQNAAHQRRQQALKAENAAGAQIFDEDESGHRANMTTLPEVERVGPYHQSVPQAMNKMWRERNKALAGKDPNGRKPGRSLIMWHRPRMMEKLVHCIQYECHIAKIRLPWDEIAHRLKPGSSGPAIIQHLNKIRDVLIQEGHMTPPNMGKALAVRDPTVRGYVRDMRQDIPTVVRKLGWGEPYEDRKESIVDPGINKGSGRYDRKKENRIVVPKEVGRRSRVPLDVKEEMTKNRVKRVGVRKKNPKDSTIKNADDSVDEDVDEHLGKIKLEQTNSPEIKGEVDPADLNSDDDYNPDVTATSNKRKSGGRSSANRKRARTAAQRVSDEFIDDDDSDGGVVVATPVKRTVKIQSQTPATVGAKAMAKLSFNTPTKPGRTSANNSIVPGSRIWEPAPAIPEENNTITEDNEPEMHTASDITDHAEEESGYDIQGGEVEEEEEQGEIREQSEDEEQGAVQDNGGYQPEDQFLSGDEEQGAVQDNGGCQPEDQFLSGDEIEPEQEFADGTDFGQYQNSYNYGGGYEADVPSDLWHPDNFTHSFLHDNLGGYGGSNFNEGSGYAQDGGDGEGDIVEPGGDAQPQNYPVAEERESWYKEASPDDFMPGYEDIL